ncbi:MAG: alpha/beta fold hydrolase [Pseudomonadota bacterium]
MSEPLVVLPGLMCDAGVFSHQTAELSRTHPVMIAPTTNGERVEQLAGQLLERLPSRFALAGHGLGGNVAMEIMRREPARVTRLCLMNTDAQADTPQISASREPQIVLARAGRFDEALRQTLTADHLAPSPDRAAVLRRAHKMAEALGPDVFVHQIRALQRRPDQQGTLRKIKVPTLIIGGAFDGVTPPRRQEFMAELVPIAKLCIFDEAGHHPALEQPELLADAMRTWMAEPLLLHTH